MRGKSKSLAEDLATAFEANPEQAILRRVDPGLARPTPLGTHVAVLYRLESVLDLTDPAVQQAMGTDRAELTAPWRLTQRRGHASPTQRLGQAVFDSGVFQAIRYESARVPGGLRPRRSHPRATAMTVQKILFYSLPAWVDCLTAPIHRRRGP